MAESHDSTSDPLSQALAELSNLVGPTNSQDFAILMDHIYYLFLLWAPFAVYLLERSGSEQEDGDEGGGAKVFPIEAGWKIFDYGSYLSTSPGENYGSYCTGKLITTAKAMIKMMADKGATKLAFMGHEIAKRAAWIECLEHNIAVENFTPTDYDANVLRKIKEAREKMRKQAGKTLAGASTQRPD